jgi:ribonuclease HI
MDSWFQKIHWKREVYIAELWGVFEGINLARRMNFSKAEVRIDSIGVVNDITHKKASKMYGRALVGRICEMLEYDWEVVFKHSYRETDHLADALAKHSFFGEG